MVGSQTDVLRSLVAALVALLEYTEEDFSEHNAKPALLTCLAEATKAARKLD